MEKIGYVKWVVWMGINMLLSLMADNVIAQPGFTSIDCGAKTNYTDENKIAWVTDYNYIDVGETADNGIGTSQPSYLQTLRFFPKPLIKSCYHLPVVPNVPYLLRLLFFLGNYRRFNGTGATFTLTIETSGMLFSTNLRIEDTNQTSYNEGIYVSSGTVLYICLIRASDTDDDPFINSIELRALRNGMYSQAEPGTMLYLNSRIDVGGNSIVRYPRDNFDRIWYTNIDLYKYNSGSRRYVRSEEFISTNNTKNIPPTAVMQTAWVMNIDNFTIGGFAGESLMLLYFAEIEKLNISESRSFYITRTEAEPSETITLARNHSALELTFISHQPKIGEIVLDVVKAPNSTSRPIINAYECYTIYQTDWPTDSHDIKALEAIKSKYDIKDWISDPCYYVPWKGLSCFSNDSGIRISEIELSGRNLTGSVSEDIGQLTTLTNVSLDNNHLIGQLPNLSNLTMLERLYLQNNRLSGSLPEWLFKLENLKELSLDNNHLIGQLPNLSNLAMLERLHLQNNNLSGSLPEWLFKLENLTELFIQNNNFSGNVSAEVRNSLNFKYFGGNNDLCIYKAGKCIQEMYPRNNSKSVVLGISISGCLIIALALMVAIALYWRKLRENQRLNKDSAMILSKQTKSRAFTPKEMMQATENFSRSIGEGGSGSVFFGKLLEEKEERDIAVKLLPSLKQFLHEVEVHSRAEHENLMSLLGYCFDAKHHILVYDHMSGGSLRDSLYGPRAAHSNLNWKTRLKIALHAAQGLQFLHEGCSSKIIHMDVKTDNILLDSNMNAKLADFGLSRVTSDGEATHATMSTVKGTHGYIDPEYDRLYKVTEKSDVYHKVTDKSDVYSFGVVLLEIICAKPPIDVKLREEERNLIQWVTGHVSGEEIDEEIIDKRLDGKYDMTSVVRVAKVALKCVSDDSRCRPSISDVIQEIKEAIIHERMNKSNESAVE